jgi:hypothetical protein
MSNLRKAAIKLAFDNPGPVQDALLPLLTKHAGAGRHPLDGTRGHVLLPQGVASKIPKLYSQEDNPDPMAWVKFFSPYGRGVWYITEFDGSETMFGWADVGHGELGYISLSQLQGANRNGLPLLERDMHWRPRPLSEAKGS